MKKSILIRSILISLAATTLCGCSVLFTPTEIPVHNGSGLISKPSSDQSTSSSDASQSSSSESSSSSGSSSSNSSEPSSEKSASYLELKEQLSYNSSGRYCLSDTETAFADKALFVGDSVCRGFSAYNIVKAKNVYAAGSTGVRNFFDKDFFYSGKETAYKDVLASLEPETVVLWMGLNDVNMTTSDEYCENYGKLIDLSLENSSANIYVCSITPISSDFTDNSRIDEFNAKIKSFISKNYDKRVGYIDLNDILKDENGKLAQGLDSGDGIHLSPECYYVIMRYICQKLDFFD